VIVKIIHRPEALRYDVYLYNDDHSYSGYVNTDGIVIWERYEPGTAPKAFNVFDEQVFNALRQAMIGEAIDKDDALHDARNIRDRLLTMVEKEWDAKVQHG